VATFPIRLIGTCHSTPFSADDKSVIRESAACHPAQGKLLAPRTIDIFITPKPCRCVNQQYNATPPKWSERHENGLFFHNS
jgi:hypothetical protein